DFLEQKIVKLQKVKTVVLDEADEMLSMGFKDDLETILKATHPEAEDESSHRAACRTWLFSATMSQEVRRLSSSYLENPETVQVNKVGGTADTIEQVYYTVKDVYKTEVIARLLQTRPEFYGIIFCQTKMEVAELADVLTQRGFPADSLHGDKSQAERESTLKKFKQRQVKVIVATDVAARGLDIKDLTHVVNHSLPWDSESYVHRIGRTGRNGQKGVAVTLVNPEQLHLLRRVMMNTKAVMTKGVVPSADEVAGLKIKDVLDRVGTMDTESAPLQLAQDLIQDLIQSEDIDLSLFSKEDLLARFIVAYFPNVFVKKDMPLDYMGDRIPRELLPRDPRDNRFSRSRNNEGYSNRDRGGDRNERNDRGSSRSSSEGRRERSSVSASSSYRPRTERSERGPRTEQRAERSERSSFSDRSEPRADRGERKEHSGIKRFRGPKKRSY
ncbi:MAG: DEAD/DEAH box helicase, partial [Bdellovibrio sp.]